MRAQALPAYVYNMWVYGARKQSSQDPLGDFLISFDYDVDYKPSALVRTQRLSLIPKIPQLEGMHIPSPDVDPHKMSLIKLLLFKPLGQSNDMDEKGNPLDPYRGIFLDAENAQKKLKRGEQENPYDVFPRAWKQYWQHTVLPKAADAQKKIEARMEWPTLWECLEVFQLQKELCQEKYLIPLDEDCERKLGCDARAKLQNRLTLQEYVCYLTQKLVKNLDAYGRAKAAPKTKSYALDADAKEDPGLQREGVGTAEAGEESFEPAFEDALDPDIDGEVRLKASDAPLKVHHPLTSSQRLQAMIFHRQKPSLSETWSPWVCFLWQQMRRLCAKRWHKSGRVALRRIRVKNKWGWKRKHLWLPSHCWMLSASLWQGIALALTAYQWSKLLRVPAQNA